MTKKDNNRQSKYTAERYMDYEPYNGVPCSAQQVLAPFVIRDEAMRKSTDIIPENLRTFKFGGKPVLVGFVPVEVSEFETILKIFNLHVNEYLNRFSNNADVISLDEMLDKMAEGEGSCDPTGIDSCEEKVLLFAMLDELIEEVTRQDERLGLILKMIYQNVDVSKQEIIAQLGLNKSQGYNLINKAQQLAKEKYDELR